MKERIDVIIKHTFGSEEKGKIVLEDYNYDDRYAAYYLITEPFGFKCRFRYQITGCCSKEILEKINLENFCKNKQINKEILVDFACKINVGYDFPPSVDKIILLLPHSNKSEFREIKI